RADRTGRRTRRGAARFPRRANEQRTIQRDGLLEPRTALVAGVEMRVDDVIVGTRLLAVETRRQRGANILALHAAPLLRGEHPVETGPPRPERPHHDQSA